MNFNNLLDNSVILQTKSNESARKLNKVFELVGTQNLAHARLFLELETFLVLSTSAYVWILEVVKRIVNYITYQDRW